VHAGCQISGVGARLSKLRGTLTSEEQRQAEEHLLEVTHLSISRQAVEFKVEIRGTNQLSKSDSTELKLRSFLNISSPSICS
jgi:hypothetical protein